MQRIAYIAFHDFFHDILVTNSIYIWHLSTFLTQILPLINQTLFNHNTGTDKSCSTSGVHVMVQENVHK